MLGGPLLSLSLWGQVLPCLEKEEDCQARQALVYIHQHSNSIEWDTQQPSDGSLGFSFSNLFGGSSKNSSSHGSSSSLTASSDSGVRSRLRVRDGEMHPEIVIEVPSLPDESGNPSLQETIPLGRVDRVTSDPETGRITLFAKKWEKDSPPKVLLNMMVWKANDDNVALPDTERNLLVHHWLVLVEWERQRRSALGDDFDEAEEGGNFLQTRARKAKHFAAREVELQQTKRSREARKAELIGKGGMKYTAIAMANRAIS